MKLTLQDLQAAMSPLSEIGKGELTFEVNGVAICLRALAPDEEIQIQRYARQAVADGDYSDQANALEYLDRFRMGALSYSIVQVGALDFRKVEYVETGEKLPNGTAIKVRKHEAVLKLISNWSRNMINATFKKFSELANKVEVEVESLIEFDEVDYDAEISRLEERLKEVRDAKNKHQLSTKDPRTDLRKQVAASGKTLAPAQSGDAPRAPDAPLEESEALAVPLDVDREVEESYEPEPDEDASEEAYGDAEEPEDSYPDEIGEPVEESPEEPAPAPVSPAPQSSRASVFDRAKGIVSPAAPAPKPPAPTPPVEATPPPQRAESANPVAVTQFDEVTDSLVDTNDPDEMNRAIEAENARLLQRRARAAAAPHLAARQADEAVNPPSERAVLAGKKDGMEVYKMPTQTMSDRKGPPSAPVSAASKAPKPTSNPKFRPVR